MPLCSIAIIRKDAEKLETNDSRGQAQALVGLVARRLPVGSVALHRLFDRVQQLRFRLDVPFVRLRGEKVGRGGDQTTSSRTKKHARSGKRAELVSGSRPPNGGHEPLRTNELGKAKEKRNDVGAVPFCPENRRRPFRRAVGCRPGTERGAGPATSCAILRRRRTAR